MQKLELNLKKVTIYYQIFIQKSTSERNYENTKLKIIFYLEGDQIPLSPNFIYLPLCDFIKTQKFNGCELKNFKCRILYE